MLFNGMRVTKKRLFLCVFSLLLILIFIFGILCRVNKININYFADSELYCEKVVSLLKTREDFMLSEVFEFDFDKAYVSEDVYGDEQYFIEKLGVDTNIDILTLETGAHNRILFIKDNTIIYDFQYEMSVIFPVESGVWIYPDTEISYAEENNEKNPFIKNSIAFSFEETQ